MRTILTADLRTSITERSENSLLKPCMGLMLENLNLIFSWENLNRV